LLPMLSGGGPSPRHTARGEMMALSTAIGAYYDVYGHLPISPATQREAASGDFTYGSTIKTPATLNPIGTMVGGTVVLNSEVIAILMDFTNFPGYPAQSTVNTNHCLNPQQIRFLNASMVSDASLPRVGPDLVYRDPWGTPYFITLDLNGDGKCLDSFYGQRAVSQVNGMAAAGYHGLTNTIDADGKGDHCQWRGRVMVWSAGPDGKINPALPANEGENKDNIVSWQ